MASRHRRPAAKPIAFGAAGAGLVGALVLTVPAPALLMQVVAQTVIVVGGNGDPTSVDQWNRIRGSYPAGAPDPVLISYPADVGIGFPGLPPLSIAGRDTYAGSADQGSDTTADAIRAAQQNGDVTVYALSLGSDVVGIALMKLGSNPGVPNGHSLTVVEAGGPSFVNSGIWNLVPPLIPGLRNGPVAQGPGESGAQLVSICIKGDSICGTGTDPVSAVFYFLPGFALHGSDYTAEKIGKYSPRDAAGNTTLEFTPGAQGEKPASSVTRTENGRTVTVNTYDDGTVTRSWDQDGTTWVVIDTGENPWGRLLRSYGLPVPAAFDQVLSTLVAVPEPGERGLLSTPISLLTAAAGPSAGDDYVGRHRVDAPQLAQEVSAPAPQQPVTGPDPASDPLPALDPGPAPAAQPDPDEQPDPAPASGDPQSDADAEGDGRPAEGPAAQQDPPQSPGTTGADTPVQAPSDAATAPSGDAGTAAEAA